MNEYWIYFQDSLIEFKIDKDNYESTLDENDVEQLNTIRVIKKEVIDMADIMDKMSGIIISQNKKLKQQNQDLKVIKQLAQGQPIEGIEES